jgi:hypothetical protein
MTYGLRRAIAGDLETLLAALTHGDGRCPELSELASGLLPDQPLGAKRLALAAHLAACARCSAILASARAPGLHSPTPEQAARLESRARGIFRERTPELLRLVVRAIGRALEVVDLSGRQLEPVPVRTQQDEGVLVRHRFGSHDLTAHVTSPEPATFAILVDVWGEPEAKRSVRLSLFRGERELASEVPRKGRVLFPAVRAGCYRVVLSDPAGYAGEIDLTLQHAA